MSSGPDGMNLIPAPDEPIDAGRFVPLSATADGRQRNPMIIVGMRHKGLGIAAGPLPDLLGLLGPPAMTALAGVAVGWLQGRAGRKVRMKVGDTEMEARTVAELREMVALAATARQKPSGTDS
jgi:hypothetical protein